LAKIKKTELLELSPLTQFTIHCAKCLTYGLPREGSNSATTDKEEKFDEKEYQRYEDNRSQMNTIFDESAELYKSKIQLGLPDEIDCIEAAYEISMNLKNEEDRPLKESYVTLDEAIRTVKEGTKEEIPFPKTHPKRFTVHASADPSNPYNEVIDYEEMDALNQTTTVADEQPSKKDSKKSSTSKTSTSTNGQKTDNNKVPTTTKRDKPQQPTNHQGTRAALVVQQLPPATLLPPESFEKTLKAIPEKLYTDFIPATVTAKKTEKSSKSDEKSEKREKSSKTDREHKKSSRA